MHQMLGLGLSRMPWAVNMSVEHAAAFDLTGISSSSWASCSQSGESLLFLYEGPMYLNLRDRRLRYVLQWTLKGLWGIITPLVPPMVPRTRDPVHVSVLGSTKRKQSVAPDAGEPMGSMPCIPVLGTTEAKIYIRPCPYFRRNSPSERRLTTQLFRFYTLSSVTMNLSLWFLRLLLLPSAARAWTPASSSITDALAAESLDNLLELVNNGTLKSYLATRNVSQTCTEENVVRRKDYTALSEDERLDYVNALKCLMDAPARTPAVSPFHDIPVRR